MAKAKEREQFIKTADLVELFGGQLSPEYISQLVKEGKLPGYRFSEKGHLFFLASEVVKALRIRVKPATKEAGEVKEVAA